MVELTSESNNKVFLTGAHGRTGKILLVKLKQYNHPVRAMVRTEEEKKELEENYQLKDIVVGDLKKLSETDFENFLDGCQVVIDAAGVYQSTNSKEINLVTYESDVRLVDAAVNKGIKRYITISALGVDHPEMQESCNICKENKTFANDQLEADRHLRKQQTLNYTIFRAGDLNDDSGTGKVYIKPKIQMNQERKTIHQLSRLDLADAIIHSLDANNLFRKTVEIINGEGQSALPITQAIEQFEQI
ncbi:hypothetical protein ABK040_012633 [Willaertia magna]